jgi:hypothetical protein
LGAHVRGERCDGGDGDFYGSVRLHRCKS